MSTLKELTADKHREAESQPFLKTIFAGNVDEAKYTDANEVSVEEAFADVETLGARDLREKYELPRDEESPRIDPLDRLLDDDVIDAAIACYEGTTASGREQWTVTLTEIRDYIKASNA
jgi:hypothetical protein